MKNKVIAVLISIIAIVVVIAVAVAAGDHGEIDTHDYYTKSVRVEKGDTLWEFGSMYKAEDDDIREWIHAVKELNGMTSSGLVAGEYIRVYVAK